MKALFCALASVLLCASIVVGDVYLHMDRGSNNRLNERTANRNNANRLFDSENNNKGGYNVGDLGAGPSDGQDEQSVFQYYSGSIMYIEWTNQHSSGHAKVRNEFILQYMCDPEMRNGENTNTPPENADDPNTGRHESRAYYAACKQRERNKGLFTADQDLDGDTAIYTRQNPNGNRHGYECPEERDYFPYWVTGAGKSPWKTLAVLTYAEGEDYEDKCDYYRKALPDENFYCGPAQWSRDNHLGNGLDGFPLSYNWTMPTPQEACGEATCPRCALRLRYNMSSSDYPWDLNSTFNGEKSPVRQNPTVDIGVKQGFRLAINTAQTGRTFQDRSHVWSIVPRPEGVGDSDKIYILSIRGKRGNIVQTYPAVEYDFAPTTLHIDEGDWVHILWTGSNTHNNQGNGNDGQAGDDGRGEGGTDKNNLVQLDDLLNNYPMPAYKQNLFDVIESIPPKSKDELILDFATAGKGRGVTPLLNNAPATFVGPLLKFKSGTYHFMCTRNNNFSNRSQKGTIIVN